MIFRNTYYIMEYNHFHSFGQDEELRRDELLRIIERSVQQLTLQELEALYYDMSTKNYIHESI